MRHCSISWSVETTKTESHTRNCRFKIRTAFEAVSQFPLVQLSRCNRETSTKNGATAQLDQSNEGSAKGRNSPSWKAGYCLVVFTTEFGHHTLVKKFLKASLYPLTIHLSARLEKSSLSASRPEESINSKPRMRNFWTQINNFHSHHI